MSAPSTDIIRSLNIIYLQHTLHSYTGRREKGCANSSRAEVEHFLSGFLLPFISKYKATLYKRISVNNQLEKRKSTELKLLTVNDWFLKTKTINIGRSCSEEDVGWTAQWHWEVIAN